ncbi:MAG: M48 family metalloprotease [Acidobacteria bacterium]|nr:M48 family metalloprotease [Acidobacteriota bacterium]
MRPFPNQAPLWLAFGLALTLTPAFAQTGATKPGAPEVKTSARKEPLAEYENPELIGKRNINKLQINFYSFDKEVAIGRQFAQEVDRSAKIVEDPIIVEYINKVGQNLVLHSDAKVPFTIKVIDSDEINAFALPGGFFYVNKGLVLAADNEAELAGPMSHEIAHVAARHGVEQASKGQIVNWGSLPLIFLGGWGGFAVRQAASLAIPMGFLKFNRSAEYEADSLGVQYLWASGYDPQYDGNVLREAAGPGEEETWNGLQNFQHASHGWRPHREGQCADIPIPRQKRIHDQHFRIHSGQKPADIDDQCQIHRRPWWSGL